jgi:hypothetical protein
MAEEEKSKDKAEPDVIVTKKKGNTFFILILVALAIIIGGGLYTFYQSALTRSSLPAPQENLEGIATEAGMIEKEMVATEEAEATGAAEATDSAETIAPVEIDETSDQQLIKRAVLLGIGLDEEEVAFTITSNTGTHAKGNIREVDAVGGGYWLAAKNEAGDWVLLYNGQANPPCSDLDKFDFPTDLAPECLDQSNNLVVR